MLCIYYSICQCDIVVLSIRMWKGECERIKAKKIALEKCLYTYRCPPIENHHGNYTTVAQTIISIFVLCWKCWECSSHRITKIHSDMWTRRAQHDKKQKCIILLSVLVVFFLHFRLRSPLSISHCFCRSPFSIPYFCGIGFLWVLS